MTVLVLLIRLLWLPTMEGVCPASVPWVAMKLESALEQAGIPADVWSVYRVSDPCPDNAWECFVSSINVRQGTSTVVLAAPKVYPEIHTRGIGGWALPGSYPHGLAVAHCAGIDACTLIALHEVLHTVGAKHIRRGCQIMRPDALRCGKRATKISRQTVREVREFLRKAESPLRA